MDQLPSFGTSISDIIGPTLKTYEPLLLHNASQIHSLKKETHPYGPHSRQQLDLYHCPNPTIINGRRAILIFLYGGGLIHGSKTLPGYAQDLCHANIASFFAEKFGYSTVVPDYRLVNQHDAKFPSGGEDVAVAVEWVVKNAERFGKEPVDLFVMGNSAGGVHLSTLLLHPDFVATRAKVLDEGHVRLRGTILLSVPFHFRKALQNRQDVLETYFGDHESKSPLGLLRSAREAGGLDILQSKLRVFVLNGELDPEDEIMKPRDDFVEEWMKIGSAESRMALAVDFMRGQNHISPFCSLGTGIEREEAWGHQVGAFCTDIRRTTP
ncbi:uncharacterized protein CLAFUR5_02547 [Fulvia fulva]|uniref:BD-FAE-like domain-containing protein n=1 Tax=Passalora fulva TaxID=5499 RepID=A0A9Q8LB21_PASFU|nr:uncharacterized protein CLAFUR5_02547 [Fulvia fulva]UJO14119.1 hypothetical protein CLAFUR5_02547 [Fulvia fulva]